jgi:peptidylprolyl isomerase
VLVGTAKRERQKANRQIRLQELAKEARKEKSKRLALRIGLVVAAFVGLVALLWWFNSDDPATVTPATTTTVAGALGSTTTVDPNAPTTTAPPKPDVQIPATVPETLVVTTLTEGTGEGAKAGDTISVHYVGVLSADGTEFDNSYDRGEPFTFVLGQGGVIQGWDQGLVGAKVGSRIQLDIPAALAYGDQQKGSVIGPNSPLTFVIDVMAITPAA